MGVMSQTTWSNPATADARIATALASDKIPN
jgi:hypothetical protein